MEYEDGSFHYANDIVQVSYFMLALL